MAVIVPSIGGGSSSPSIRYTGSIAWAKQNDKFPPIGSFIYTNEAVQLENPSVESNTSRMMLTSVGSLVSESDNIWPISAFFQGLTCSMYGTQVDPGPTIYPNGCGILDYNMSGTWSIEYLYLSVSFRNVSDKAYSITGTMTGFLDVLWVRGDITKLY